MAEFYRVISEYARARSVKDHEVKHEPAIRLYCEQAGECWNLQVRAIRAAGGHYGKGKDFFVSTAPLNRADLLALRAAIDNMLSGGV